jgi:hypothetical protein
MPLIKLHALYQYTELLSGAQSFDGGFADVRRQVELVGDEFFHHTLNLREIGWIAGLC